MRRHLRYLCAAIALTTAACADNQLAPGRASDTATEITTLTPRFSLVPPPTVCPTVAQSQKTVDSLLPQIFGPGQGRRGKAQGYSNNIEQARKNGNTQLEQAYVDSLINYTLDNYYSGNLIGGQSEATQIRVLNFFYAMYCASGITPIPDLSMVFDGVTRLIRNGTPTTTVSADSAAVKIEQGDVPTTVFGTYVTVVKTTDPLPTSLDWYGGDGYKLGAYEFIANPPVEFTSPVLTGVCIQFDDAIVSATDLRMAHAVPAGSLPTAPGNTVLTTAGGTIEIAAYADPGPLGLDCDPLPPPSASRGFLGNALHQFARLFVPEKAWAITSGGSTGGTVRKFSPFAAVDIKLSQSVSGPSSPQYIPIGSTQITAPVTVTVTTRHGGTPIADIGVSLDPAGSFSPASGSTNASGQVSSTWTLVAGTNTGSATSAQSPLVFVPATANFSVNVIQLLAVSITTTSLPNGTVGTAYSQALQAADGDGSYTWSLVGGALPAGLSLSAAGVISGTPTTVGSSSFTVQVSSAGTIATQALSIAINYPTALGALTFVTQPSNTQCNRVITPNVAVRVTSTNGTPLPGVQVSIVAVTNNGAPVVVSQPSAVSGADGVARFNTLSINKTGGYRLIASTGAPWPVASAQSGKFNVSPAC